MSNRKLNLALIPARGGSKRLPGKNLVDLAGKPLIAHSIIYATNQSLIDEVWVSTDDQDISSVAKSYGAKVVKRPSKLADDYTPTSEVIKYHAQNFIDNGKNLEWIFLLQPTNPLRPSQLVSKAFGVLKEEGKKALACFSPLDKKFGKIRDHTFYPENYSFGQRSQDIEKRYYENGLLYIISIELAKRGELFPSDLFPYVVKSIHGTVDIDDKDDLEYSKIILEYMKKNN